MLEDIFVLYNLPRLLLLEYGLVCTKFVLKGKPLNREVRKTIALTEKALAGKEITVDEITDLKQCLSTAVRHTKKRNPAQKRVQLAESLATLLLIVVHYSQNVHHSGFVVYLLYDCIALMKSPPIPPKLSTKAKDAANSMWSFALRVEKPFNNILLKLIEKRLTKLQKVMILS